MCDFGKPMFRCSQPCVAKNLQQLSLNIYYCFLSLYNSYISNNDVLHKFRLFLDICSNKLYCGNLYKITLLFLNTIKCYFLI